MKTPREKAAVRRENVGKTWAAKPGHRRSDDTWIIAAPLARNRFKFKAQSFAIKDARNQKLPIEAVADLPPNEALSILRRQTWYFSERNLCVLAGVGAHTLICICAESPPKR
ncbi:MULTISPECIES: hypothetical protein [Ralstonia]|jgi:hypothetical protein|uniref:hypothetical protein n=1 Tax=Ralstonia TaxID=48736 RepID=UPI0018EE3A8A|nr:MULTISPECIES: hypothetical protein [unclassified Ralstonia]